MTEKETVLFTERGNYLQLKHMAETKMAEFYNSGDLDKTNEWKKKVEQLEMNYSTRKSYIEKLYNEDL